MFLLLVSVAVVGRYLDRRRFRDFGVRLRRGWWLDLGFGLLPLFLNGMLLATGFVLTNQLAIPVALHMGWNFFEGALLGFPVSGDRDPASVLALHQRDPV
jgi:hypothetical protein